MRLHLVSKRRIQHLIEPERELAGLSSLSVAAGLSAHPVNSGVGRQ
jgi:hypothetical protein